MINDNDPKEIVGGTERYVMDVTKGLEAAGHRVYLFATSRHRSSMTASQMIFKTEIINRLRWDLHHIYFYPKLYQVLREYITQIQPDVVHLHNNRYYPITVLAAIRRFRVVQTVHDYCALYPTAFCTHEHSCALRSIFVALRHGCMKWKTLLAEGWLLYNRRFLDRRIVDQFVAPSRDLTQHLESRGYAGVVHLPNFTSLSTTSEGLMSERRIVLYVGSLIAHKGVDVLLRAYGRIQNAIDDVILWLVGTGPDENHLRTLAEKLELRRVTFWGRQHHQKLTELYQNAQVIVIPSLWFENAPLVAFEAMSHSRAIIASKVGGLPELVVDGENGYLFTRGDSVDLSEKMRAVLTDRTLALNLGAEGRRRLAELSTTAHHVDRLITIYQGERV